MTEELRTLGWARSQRMAVSSMIPRQPLLKGLNLFLPFLQSQLLSELGRPLGKASHSSTPAQWMTLVSMGNLI